MAAPIPSVEHSCKVFPGELGRFRPHVDTPAVASAVAVAPIVCDQTTVPVGQFAALPPSLMSKVVTPAVPPLTKLVVIQLATCRIPGTPAITVALPVKALPAPALGLFTNHVLALPLTLVPDPQAVLVCE